MNHFSHHHQLEPWNFNFQIQSTSQSLLPFCSCCKLPSNEPMYFCMGCNFFLHFSCTQFPQLINHPSHKNHTLNLLPTAAYPGGAFNCDACNRQGNGFSYHCSSCEYDLHVGCAFKPLTIIHQFHPCPLELTFTKPYENAKGFSCDVCHKIGFKEWLYRCSSCEFDVHLDCAASASSPEPAAAVVHGGQQGDQFLQGGSGSAQISVMVSTQYSDDLLHHHQLMQSAGMGGDTMAHRQSQPGNAAEEAVMHGQVRRPNFVHTESIGEFGSGSVSQSSLMMNSGIQGLVRGNSQGVGRGSVKGMITGGGGGGYGLGAIIGDSSKTQK